MSYEMDRIRHVGDSPAFTRGGMSNQTFTTKVMPTFGLALLLTAGGAYLGQLLLSRGMPMGMLWAFVIAELAIAFTVPMWQRKEGLNKFMFLLYAVFSGITLVPLLAWAGMQGGVGIIVQALAVTTVTFGGLAAYGYTTKRDFTGMGGFIVAAMIGLLVGGLLNYFVFQSSMFSLIASVFGVGIFSAFTVYEMNMIRSTYEDADYIGAAMGLFIAFMGMFTSILRLFGFMSGNDD